MSLIDRQLGDVWNALRANARDRDDALAEVRIRKLRGIWDLRVPFGCPSSIPSRYWPALTAAVNPRSCSPVRVRTPFPAVGPGISYPAACFRTSPIGSMACGRILRSARSLSSIICTEVIVFP